MHKAVLFDLDDTLHDRTGAIPEFVTQQGRSLLSLSEHQAKEFAARFVELEQRGRVWKDQVYGALGREFSTAPEMHQALLADYMRSFPLCCRLRPGVTELLTALRTHSLKVGIVTNGRVDMQSTVVDALGLGAVVDTVVISEQVGWRKPQPEIFRLALARLGCDVKSAAFVGDDLIADVGGALSAGFEHVFWFDSSTDEQSTTPAGATRVTTIEALARTFR